MERLKGKTILVGREPGQERLLVAIAGGNTAAIGAPGSVPGSVSRYKPAENMAHARITVDQSGNLTLSNMNDNNVTYVNGSEIVSKRISPSSAVALGKDRFSVSISTILETAKKIIGGATPPPPPEEFDIRHLEAIYNEYHAKIIERQRKQKKLGILASCSMFFTIGGGAVAAVANKLGMGETAQDYIWVLPVIGFIVFFISMYMRIKDTSIEDADATNLEYTKHFVCPNPKCGKFLGNMPYELMKIQYSMQCPYCKCKFVER